ncbi:MAG TPA: hypothetical protein VHD56_03730 [Tepidisphaeraceae bacterium]|nr:hypothetical protein [Tepidisphaeraceae bacterium]
MIFVEPGKSLKNMAELPNPTPRRIFPARRRLVNPTPFFIKRRGGDSNSRDPCGPTGFRNRPDSDANDDTSVSCDPATTGLPEGLRLALEQHPELSKLIESWPNLPPSMRIGIIAMVESSADGK